MNRAPAGLLLLLTLVSTGFCAEDTASASGKEIAPGVIELPKFVVTDTRDLPPPEQWRYGTIPGFEILTNASEKSTQRLIRDFQLFREALSYVWPISPRTAAPTPLIICGRGGKYDQFIEKKKSGGPEVANASLFLNDHEHSAIVIDYESKELNVLSMDGDDAASGTDFGRIDIDHNKLLYREYVRFLLSQSEPRLPAWFEEGMAQIVMAMQFDRRSIIIGRLEDPNTVSAQAGMVQQLNALNAAAGDSGDGMAIPSAPAEDRDFNAALRRQALVPMDKFFAVTHDSPEAQNPLGNNVWAKQAYAFVHLCIYGDNGKWQKPFATFVTRMAKEPVTEAMFKDCFKMSYNQFLTYLRGYIEFTNYQSKEFYARKGQQGLEEPPPLVLRDATQSEVGRVKGQVMLLGGHKEAAKRELIAPYIRGERDPRLMAVLGSFERANGEEARGRKLIEEAVRQKVDLPEAYLELAKLRFAETTAKIPNDAGITPEQTNSIISLLKAARQQKPPLGGTYDLMADTWMRSAAKPAKEDLFMLVEGVQLFPGHLKLVYESAVLCADGGVLDAAHSLADWGIKRAPDPTVKAKFETLKASFPPEPPKPAAETPAAKKGAPQPAK